MATKVPGFLMESNFVNNIQRGPPKEHSCQVESKLASRLGREDVLGTCWQYTTQDRHKTTLNLPIVLRWSKVQFSCHGNQSRVSDGIKFCEQSLQRTSQGTFLPSLVQIGPAVWEEMFKEIVNNAQRTWDHPKVPLQHVVLMWVYPFPNKPWFLCACSTSLLKTL